MRRLELLALAAVLILVMSADAYSVPSSYGPFTSELYRVVAGNTIKAKVGIWPGRTRFVDVTVRGVMVPRSTGNIPDCEEEAAYKAAAFTRRFLKNASFTISNVYLRTYVGEASGRYAGEQVLADVVNSKGFDLGRALLAAGHGRPYKSGRREPWCSTSKTSKKRR